MSIRHTDTSKHLTKVCEMLPSVFEKESYEHWIYHMLVQEIIGNILLGDYDYAANTFGYLNQKIQECLKKP